MAKTTAKRFNLSEEDKTLFLGALRMGLGLSHACSYIYESPKEVSLEIANNEVFKKECQDAVKYAARLLLITAQQAVGREDYNSIKKTQVRMAVFVTELVLWESMCKKEQVTPAIISKAVHLYKTKYDCATAIGMTLIEFTDYVASDMTVAIYFATNHIYGY